ncbi:MAG: glyoxalase-like domain protein [Thiothrix sp.]|nr:MAG: glyoxalase-like domain protein [Thiothrix sp.]
MSFELDHIFIATTANAPEADLLKALGLTEGTPNQHHGQGTANRRFFFQNVFIELIYLVDAAEAQTPVVQPTHLYERLQQQDIAISPFGICFRPQSGTNADLPFACWDYRPPYLPTHLSIPMAQANPLTEPLWFVLPFGVAPALAALEKRQPLEHKLGLQQVTAIRITQPTAPNSEVAHYANQVAGFTIQQGEAHLLELSFDHQQAGLSHDFKPHLPLVLHW